MQNILKDYVAEGEKGANWLLRVFNTGSELTVNATEMRQFSGKAIKMHYLLKDPQNIILGTHSSSEFVSPPGNHCSFMTLVVHWNKGDNETFLSLSDTKSLSHGNSR